MSDFNRGYERADMSVDAGLGAFMIGAYNKVAQGLCLSAGLAFLTGPFPPVRDLMFTQAADGRIGHGLPGMVVAFSPLFIILISMFAMRNSSPTRPASSTGPWFR